MRRFGLAVAIVLVVGSAGRARADLTLWNESAKGDLSGNSAAPTSIGTLGVGNNLVVGSLVDDADDFTFTVGAGLKLDGIILNAQSGSGSPNFYLVSGSSIDPSNAIGVLNWTVSHVSVGDNLFDKPGFFQSGSSPLGPGTYTVGFAGFTYDITAYTLDLHATNSTFTPAPEPSTLVGAGTGIVMLAGAAWRRRRARGVQADFVR
jgi:hypothetical protein